jgi:acetylornithine/succinyldiaminopimelate/putrescine aminotransferase
VGLLLQGIYVWDRKGTKYLDALAGLWCVSLGKNDFFAIPKVAIQKDVQVNTNILVVKVSATLTILVSDDSHFLKSVLK